MEPETVPALAAVLIPESMGPFGKTKQPIKMKNKTRRGRGRQNQRGDNFEGKFTIWGNNSNGLKAKINSLKANVEFFKRPSCITIQETKLRQSNVIKIDGYKVFEKMRTGFGGGLLTAVIEELEPVLICN